MSRIRNGWQDREARREQVKRDLARGYVSDDRATDTDADRLFRGADTTWTPNRGERPAPLDKAPADQVWFTSPVSRTRSGPNARHRSYKRRTRIAMWK